MRLALRHELREPRLVDIRAHRPVACPLRVLEALDSLRRLRAELHHVHAARQLLAAELARLERRRCRRRDQRRRRRDLGRCLLDERRLRGGLGDCAEDLLELHDRNAEVLGLRDRGEREHGQLARLRLLHHDLGERLDQRGDLDLRALRHHLVADAARVRHQARRQQRQYLAHELVFVEGVLAVLANDVDEPERPLLERLARAAVDERVRADVLLREMVELVRLGRLDQARQLDQHQPERERPVVDARRAVRRRRRCNVAQLAHGPLEKRPVAEHAHDGGVQRGPLLHLEAVGLAVRRVVAVDEFEDLHLTTPSISPGDVAQLGDVDHRREDGPDRGRGPATSHIEQPVGRELAEGQLQQVHNDVREDDARR